MLDLILALIQNVNKAVMEEPQGLPTVTPKKEHLKWFPFYELEEIVVLKRESLKKEDRFIFFDLVSLVS